ncbi:AAA family ATPase [Chryseobacterium jejuense]|uniref:Predicted ATP-dependent endonuclease of the OLD family, contains P-loop ATPase and TOPRIM domains n=1 Tax=Chryseobacterium jejuense TaxID=445960 RepID=A0A2X2VM09_CHRJE|nr:AAA family ATPase [Chryseobacterium jejuense]SDJ09752.1 Predicted ATP-dependent endonuclease of the OLD family, contains P-loop ATPase and TOPRIM domains [Chryseobacterium jejuense]SQB27867.1 recombination protein F [Chryseobacterium jejuense]
MRIKQIQVRNFRLLDNFSVNIEDDITLIVGKNNTGKTSLFEAINIFTKASQEISFEDFSLSSYLKFKKIVNFINRVDFNEISERRKEFFQKIIQNQTPKVQLFIEFEYDIETDCLINLSEFITDLNEERNDATVLISFESINSLGLFSSFLNRERKEIELISWLKENLKKYYQLTCYAIDKNSNFKKDIGLNFKSKIEKVVSFEDIKASRTLDDTKSDKNKTLATGFSHYYRERDKTKEDVKRLEDTLTKVSVDLKNEYEKVLKDVISDLNHFGASTPISIPKIEIDSEFNSEAVIKNNIKYYYKHDDINLPESYNGLGYSNLIFMVLELTSFIERFKNASEEKKSEFLTILIEEPEAHMHPQMQQVFIKQITNKINNAKSNGINIQLIITTHSSHIIAEAGIDLKKGFDRIRYFNKINGNLEVNDFNNFKHKKSDTETFRFLKQYLNLHKCDIFFADKVIMVEGITEKMLLPIMINKVAPELNKKYISILEVGGAYTHKFKELLNFIKVKTLVITDIDSVQLDNNRKACRVNTPNSVTSNSTLKNWIPKKDSIVDLISTRVEEKFDGEFIRVCYQIAENAENQYTARSLEEAIINRNLIFFKSKYNDLNEENTLIEIQVKSKFELLKNINFEETSDLYNLSPQKGEKSQFAFDLMTFKAGIEDISWNVPKYIGEGLEWLEKDE